MYVYIYIYINMSILLWLIDLNIPLLWFATRNPDFVSGSSGPERRTLGATSPMPPFLRHRGTEGTEWWPWEDCMEALVVPGLWHQVY